MVTYLFITLLSAAAFSEGEPSSLASWAEARRIRAPARAEVGGNCSSPASRSLMRDRHVAERESFLVSLGHLTERGRAGEEGAWLELRRAAGFRITSTCPYQGNDHLGPRQFQGESFPG